MKTNEINVERKYVEEELRAKLLFKKTTFKPRSLAERDEFFDRLVEGVCDRFESMVSGECNLWLNIPGIEDAAREALEKDDISIVKRAFIDAAVDLVVMDATLDYGVEP